MALRRVLDGDEMIADPADMAERAHGLGGVLQQGVPEGGIGPGFGDDLRAVVRADLGFVGLDDGIERGRIDIAFFGQNVSSARTRSSVSDKSEWSWSW